LDETNTPPQSTVQGKLHIVLAHFSAFILCETEILIKSYALVTRPRPHVR